MSGGSYNYLCHKDAPEIVEAQGDLQEMADRLARLGYAEDAAVETTEVLLEVRQAMVRINARIGRLREVWRAVEWWDSGDIREGGVRLALENYRKEK